MAGFLLMIQLVIGFFATAGACGADFCSNNRDKKDVQMGGLVGVALATLFAGGLAVLGVAGAHGALTANIGATENATTYGQLANYTLSGSLQSIVPVGDKLMLILFAIGSVAPACFCSFIIGNSLSTMLAKPQARVGITMAGATVGIVLAALGIAGNLAPFFGLIGASFGPVIGAMIADYLLSGKKWAGPRAGISVPGYAAWLIGFLVGISNNGLVTAMLGKELLPGWHPTGVYSLIVGFIVYALLAKMGLEGKAVELPAAVPAPAPGPTP
jgi:cytosine permease